jgi:hypothetical protein
MPYDSEHAWDFADRIFEFVSYMAIDESANLAQERGAYANFAGSEWSKGLVPIDSLKRVAESRGVPLTVDPTSKHKGLNWNILRAKVRNGMRNATLMAVAPNANIGLVVGTTPGIDARFAQVFSRNKISGKYLDLNHNLVKDLKNMGIWEKVREGIIENQGDISGIEGIPQSLKEIYKTSFTTSPHAYIEVAARAQKWVDQALSRNMYLATRDLDETMDIYMSAWKKGLKSTYYLHMKPRHTAEQSTTKVNKAEKMGKSGFAAVASAKRSDDDFIAQQVAEQELIPTPLSDAEIARITVENRPTVSVPHSHEPQTQKATENSIPYQETSKTEVKGFGAVASPRNELVMNSPLELKTTDIFEPVKVESQPEPQDAMREMMAQLAKHPNATPNASAASVTSAPIQNPIGFTAPKPQVTPASTYKKPTLTPAQVQEMMDNFGKKPAHSSSASYGVEDPGTANICIGCE